MNKPLLNLLPYFLILFSCDNINMDSVDSSDTTPPIINITYPANQSVVSDTVLITAHAFDNDRLETVRLFLNDSILFESQLGPYEYLWNTKLFQEDESFNIRASAKDSAGNMTISQSIEVQIDNQDNIKPNGIFLFPSSGQKLNGIIEISVQADDNDRVAYIDLFINGDSIGTFNENPTSNDYYHYFWDTNGFLEDNINTIHAHIVDASNNFQVIGPVSITIDNIDAPDITFPQGTITYPPAGSTVSGEINIEINAFDNIAISYTKFIINGELHSIDSIAPYTYNWNTNNEIEDQNHTISVDIVDHVGNLTTLYPISVFVNNIEEPDLIPPNIVIYDPAGDQTVSGAIEILTIATDNDSVDRVEFYHNYNLEYIDTIPFYTYTWNTLDEDEDTEHIWYALAYDISGNSSQTDPMTITVDNIDNEPPGGGIIYPYAGQVVYDTVIVQTEVFDNIGISQVEFMINGSVVYIDDEQPFYYDWNTIAYSDDQEYLLSILISDIAGNIFEDGISVVVNNNPIPDNDNVYPYASILNPVSGQTVNDTITVLGFATDNYTVTQVQFFINNEIVSTMNDTPYTFQWNTIEFENNAEHVLTMTAEDQAGNITTAQPVLINISNP